MRTALLTSLLALLGASPGLAQEVAPACTRSFPLGVEGERLPLVFAPDGTRFATGGAAPRLWEVAGEGNDAPPSTKLRARGAQALAFLLGGQRLALAGADHRVRILDLESGFLVHTFKGHTGPVVALDVSPDGAWLVSGGEDGDARVWSLETGRLRKVIHGDGRRAGPVAFDPSGKRIATAETDGSVRIWRVHGGLLQRTLRHPEPVVSVAWSPHDGHVLASGCEDGSLRLWNLQGGGRSQELPEAHAGPADRLAFDDFGALLASGGPDGCVRVWNVGRAKLLTRYPDHGARIAGLSFSPGRRELYSVSAAGIARMWTPAEALARAEEAAPGPVRWTTDPELALARAREEGRPILADFFADW